MPHTPPDFAEQLRQRVDGEVRFDKYSRVLYSTDASLWQIEPVGAVIPRTADDVQATVELCAKHKVPILPRGGATSLSGQTVGEAVHIDFAKYLHQIVETNLEEEWVRVQPGVTQDQLNRHLNPLGFRLGPNTSSASRATIGGMVGNNSAGSHSILYGKAIDHVLELDAVLSDGSRVHLAPAQNGVLEAKSQGDSLEAQLYQGMVALGMHNADRVRERFPRLMRRVSGYNLDEFVPENGHWGTGISSEPGPFHLGRAIVGSEGTLAIVTEVKMRIVPLPKTTGVLIVYYPDVFAACESVPAILESDVSAAELIDDFILNQARQQVEFARRMDFVDPAAQAMMVVEFYGESESEVAGKVEELRERLVRNKIGFGHQPVLDSARQKTIWQVRKESLGLMMGVKGDSKPVAFVEDPGVPIEKLPTYLRGFRDILERYKAHGGYYGHASVGCLHVRPMINMKTAEGVRSMTEIADQVAEVVAECGGSMSGEHGDGIARSKYNRTIFGEELYNAFLETKKLWDPDGILNPGKIVNGPDLDNDLRWGPNYETIQIQTHLDFSREGGFARAIENCNGAGVCRKRNLGTMCPSYHATLDEEHSTRGRANLLRAAISGTLPKEEFTSKRMYEALDLCLECKACARECPSSVDMAKIKYEFLAHYYKKNGTPVRARMFAGVNDFNRIAGSMPRIANAVLRSAPVRWAMGKIGVDARRSLPAFAKQTFTDWFAERPRRASAGRKRVAIFPDCFTNWNYPQTGRAAVKVLEAAGYAVEVTPVACCGRAMISKGLLDEAKENARTTAGMLRGFAERGVPIVGCEPSCLLTFRDEFPDLLSGVDMAGLDENTFLLEEFLLDQEAELRLQAPEGKKVLYHGHCHQKAQVGTAPSVKTLQQIEGAKISEINSGCCGMAGSFGFEAEHYELSEKIGRERLFPAIEAEPGADIAINGVSCRQQIEHFTGRTPKHVAEVLSEALADD